MAGAEEEEKVALMPDTHHEHQSGHELRASSPVRVHQKISCAGHGDQEKERRLMADIDHATSTEPACDDEEDKQTSNSCKVIMMISLTFLFFVVELTFGFINRSIALLADSYHMLSDVMALVIAFICLRISKRKSKRNGFGWVRAEVLGALVNSVFLLAMCFTISLESLGRLVHPRPMSHPVQVLIVGAIGLLINFLGMFIFHGHGHSHGGHGHSHGGGGGVHGHSHSEKGGHGHSHDKKGGSCDSSPGSPDIRMARAASTLSTGNNHLAGSLRWVNLDENAQAEEFLDSSRKKALEDAENLNMRGVFLHILSDAIGSVVVIVTAGIAYFFPGKLGPVELYLDPILSMCLVGLISFSAYSLLSQAATIILRRPPLFLDMIAIKKDLKKIIGVASINEIHAWTLVANRHLATAEMDFCSLLAYDQAIPKIRKVFHRHGIHSLTIQPHFSSTCEPIEENGEDGVSIADSEGVAETTQ